MNPIEVIEGVTPRMFREEIARGGRPVVMRGAVETWPLVAEARRSPAHASDYIKRFDQGKPVETIFGGPEINGRFFYNSELNGRNFVKRPARLSAALDALVGMGSATDSGSIYVQSAPIGEFLPGLDRENTVDLLDPDIAPRIWIGNRLTVQTHFDLSSNVACVAAGRRCFTLFPPDQLPNLYVGPFELTLAGPPVSMVRLEEPDFERFPRFRAALEVAQTAILEPGDALFIPYFWWHHVESLDPFNILVNYWWNDAGAGSGSPFDALLHAILALRDLPQNQKDIWRTALDYYVFGSHGDPVEHLPESARGALGPHSPAMRGQLWMAIANAAARNAKDEASRMRNARPQS